MKVRLSFVPFIPIAIAMVVFKMMSLVAVDSNGFVAGMDRVGVAYTVIGGALALFLLCVLVNIFDKKTAPVYEIRKNPIAGVMACISAVLISGVSLFDFLNLSPASKYYFMAVITALSAIPAAIALFVMCTVHFRGKTTVNSISLLYIFPCLWSCTQLIGEFLNATKISVTASDMSQMFCYIFLTLYFFSYSMIISRIQGRNPVKACYIYGLPAAAICLAYGVYVFSTTIVNGAGRSNMLIGGMFVILAVYILSFVVEMSFNLIAKEDVKIVESYDDDEHRTVRNETDSDPDDINQLVFSKRNSRREDMEKFKKERKNKGENTEEKSRPTSKDLDDFVIGFNSKEDRSLTPYLSDDDMKKHQSIETIITAEGGNHKDEQMPVVEDNQIETIHDIVSDETNKDSKKNSKTKKSSVAKDTLDEIDLLLQELESKK